MYASRHAADACASSDKVLAPAVQQDKRQRRLAPVTNGSCARQPARVVGSQDLGKGEATGGRASPATAQPIRSGQRLWRREKRQSRRGGRGGSRRTHKEKDEHTATREAPSKLRASAIGPRLGDETTREGLPGRCEAHEDRQENVQRRPPARFALQQARPTDGYSGIAESRTQSLAAASAPLGNGGTAGCIGWPQRRRSPSKQARFQQVEKNGEAAKGPTEQGAHRAFRMMTAREGSAGEMSTS